MVSGLLVYLVYRFISPLFIFPCVLSINQINRFIGLFGLSVYFSTVYFTMRSLNKPNKPVYFSMRSLTKQWDSVRFIGLFGLSVYFSTVYFPCILSINQINRFISPCVLSLDSGIVSGLLVYLVYRFISPLFIFPCVLSINQINRFISPCILSLDSGIVSGLLVYWFISPLFIFPCILSINQINLFISPCILSLNTRIVSGLLVYLVYWFISLLFFHAFSQ